MIGHVFCAFFLGGGSPLDPKMPRVQLFIRKEIERSKFVQRQSSSMCVFVRRFYMYFTSVHPDVARMLCQLFEFNLSLTTSTLVI